MNRKCDALCTPWKLFFLLNKTSSQCSLFDMATQCIWRTIDFNTTLSPLNEPKCYQCGIQSRVVPTTAPWLDNAVFTGHWPRLVTIIVRRFLTKPFTLRCVRNFVRFTNATDILYQVVSFCTWFGRFKAGQVYCVAMHFMDFGEHNSFDAKLFAFRGDEIMYGDTDHRLFVLIQSVEWFKKPSKFIMLSRRLLYAQA